MTAPENPFDHPRRYPRLDIQAAVEYRSPNLQLLDETLNLSLGGMFLATGNLDAVGTSAEIGLSLPGTGTLLQVRGTVRWSTLDWEINAQRVPDPSGMGVEFDEASSHELRDALVRHYGEQLLPEDPFSELEVAEPRRISGTS